MKHFVLYSSKETPHLISESEFEKHTKNEFPFKQKEDDKNRYYATCPECENPIQIRGLYTNDNPYGAHAGKDINGLNKFDYDNYMYCPRAVQGKRLPKESRKKVTTEKDITIYNTIRENFDLAVAFAKKYLGYYISDDKAKECLEIYYASEGWLYPHSTVNNIPFIIFYLQPALNPYGLLVKKDSELEKAILTTKDLKLETVKGKIGEHYTKLTPNSNQYMSLTMMIWNHVFKEDESGALKESVNIEICKDISKNLQMHDWKTLLDKKINIPELAFVKFINSNSTFRNKDLQEFAKQLMPPL